MHLWSWLFTWRTLVAKMGASCLLPSQSPSSQKGVGEKARFCFFWGLCSAVGPRSQRPWFTYISGFSCEGAYVPIFPFIFSGLTPEFLSSLHFCLCVCTCRSQKTAWCCSNSDTTHFGFSDGVSYWPRVLWVRLGWVTSKPQVPACLCLPDLDWHYRHVPPIVSPKLSCIFLGSCALCGLRVLPFPSAHPIANGSLLLNI